MGFALQQPIPIEQIAVWINREFDLRVLELSIFSQRHYVVQIVTIFRFQFDPLVSLWITKKIDQHLDANEVLIVKSRSRDGGRLDRGFLQGSIAMKESLRRAFHLR